MIWGEGGVFSGPFQVCFLASSAAMFSFFLSVVSRALFAPQTSLFSLKKKKLFRTLGVDYLHCLKKKNNFERGVSIML